MGDFGTLFANGNRGPVQEINFIVNPSGTEFHAQNEKVRRDRVSLPYTPGGLEELSSRPIGEGGEKSERDTRHVQHRKFSREIEEIENMSYKRSFNSIKNFL